MRLKRGLQATILALAVIALMAPASAGAAEEGLWWYDHDFAMYPTSAGKKVAMPFGEDFALIAEGNEYGPCESFQLEGEMYNEYEGMGEGKFQKALSSGENCPTSIAGCTVDELKPTGFDWSITLKSNGKVVLSGVDIELKLNKSCEGKTELPLTSTASGTVEGTFQDYVPPGNPEVEEGIPTTVVFDEEEGLKVGELEVKIDGRLKFGTKVTALPEPSGQVFTAAQYPVDLAGAQILPSVLELSGGRKIECEGVSVKGKLYSISEILRLTSEYTACTATFGLPAEIVTECAGVAEHYDSVLGYTFSSCTAGFTQQAFVYDSKKEKIICLYEVDEPINGTSVSYENLGGTEGIAITREFEGIGYTRISGSALNCGPATGEATLTEAISVEAATKAEESVALDVG
jgi:hypothetical protein